MTEQSDRARSVAYPLQVGVEYAETQARLKAAFRLPLSAPALFFTLLLQTGAVFAIWAAILVSGRIPRWLFEFQVGVNRWQTRAISYALLLSDVYPAFEGAHPVTYGIEHPARSSRWRLVAWKFFTSLPHGLTLFFLALSLVPVSVVAWCSIVVTGRYPKVLHGYTAGVLRWSARVQAYVQSLTDEYPPFSRSAGAGPATARTYRLSIAGAVLLTGALVAGGIWQQNSGQLETVEVSYAGLLTGEVEPAATRLEVETAIIEITDATDPADDRYEFLTTNPDARLVEFALAVDTTDPGGPAGSPDASMPVRGSDFSLKDTTGARREPLLTVAGGKLAPRRIRRGAEFALIVVFEVPSASDPSELRWDVFHYIEGARGRRSFPRVGETIVYQFR